MKIPGIRCFAVLLAASLVICPGSDLRGQDAARVEIAPSASTSTIYRVQSRLDGRGTVTTDQEQSINLRLDARFEYDERVIARRKLLKSVRDYKKARAEIRLGSGSIINELPEDRRLIIAQVNDPNKPVKLAPVGGPITQKEFELIDVPANTLILAELVSKPDVEVGKSWVPEENHLARFLNIDSISESNVQIKLEKVEKGIAWIYVGGDVSGRVDDANTKITVTGTIHFDIRKGYARGCEVTINQQRDIGRLTPGLNATFKMIMRMAPVETSRHLTNEGLAELRENAGSISDDFVLITHDEAVELLHSRDWRVIAEKIDRAILRLNSEGEMIGQCDIISLPPRPVEKPQTLDQFRQVVEAKLADHSPSIMESNQATTDSGLQWMRVTASGTTDGVRLIWTYYTISHEDGQRVQLVFTSEPELNNRFSRKFESLITSIVFLQERKTKNASFKK